MKVDAKKTRAELIAWGLYLGAIYGTWALIFPQSWRQFVDRFQALLEVSEPVVYLTLLSPFFVRLLASYLQKTEETGHE